MLQTTVSNSQVLSVLPCDHTMGNSLLRYVEMKMHQRIRENQSHDVLVVGKYSRNPEDLSIFEKSDKLFNWKRPTVSTLGDTLTVECFPGEDYVYHYASLISTYYSLLGRDISVSYVNPTLFDCYREIYLSQIAGIPRSEVVILGYVEQLSSLLPQQEWTGSGDFLYKIGFLNGKVTMLLGCLHSYWGDISGRLVEAIAQRGTETVIYVGKLGALKPQYQANSFLATGNISFLKGEIVQWDNLFGETQHTNLAHGSHYTLPSVIQETADWCNSVKHEYSFVDPEIGHMAAAANRYGIRFGYLHLISDNLVAKYSEDLSNERDLNILSKRANLLNSTKEILVRAI